jgi:biopolymer transport protein ExbD
MKFPRNVRIAKGSFDAAPWVTVMFLLVIFVMLGGLLYTPGVRIQLPVAQDLPGTDKPTITVALDAAGGLYYQNQKIADQALLVRLKDFAREAPEKPVLVVQADKGVSYDKLVRLTQMARAAGIDEAVLATLPGIFRQAEDRAPRP